MPDPAILALLQHLSWSPPAVVQTAASMPEPWLVAFDKQVTEIERQVDTWIANGGNLQSDLWAAILAHPEVWTVEALTSMIDSYEKRLKLQTDVTARLAEQVDHNRKSKAPELAKVAGSLLQRILVAYDRFMGVSADFALFMRAIRAEIDPRSRGGDTFESPSDLEKYLLTQVA